MGIDIPGKRAGLIPTPRTYNRIYGEGHWNFCTFRSVSIGQGEVLTTPLQVANEMAYIANKGWYVTPHMIDSIDGGDKLWSARFFQIAPHGFEYSRLIFEYVADGMQGVMEQEQGGSQSSGNYGLRENGNS